MKWLSWMVYLGLALPGAASPSASVTVSLQPGMNSASIPADFVGLSFGMKALLPDTNGNHFFSPTNQPLITLFRNLGISHLRVGGTTVESPPETPIPDHAAIDDLFAFAEKAGIKKIIYSFRLLETNADLHYDLTNAALAKYIWDNHRDLLDCFAIANEPDLQRVFKQDYEVRNFETYFAKWRRFATAITNAVPDAKFAGPDAASPKGNWTTNFAERLKNASYLWTISEHYYPGGAGRDVAPEKGIDDMLSAKWVSNYGAVFAKTEVPLLQLGLAYRFTEANDYYSGGVKDGSDTFAGALWALDFLHWWTVHGASGVDFHNTQWVVNDVITLDENREPVPNPKAYGLKAFELGSHGIPEPLNIENPAQVDLTAYAVLNVTAAQGRNAYLVTVINKEHSSTAHAATVTIALPDKAKLAEVIYLVAPENDAAAKTGVTLGGEPVSNRGMWQGAWKSLTPNEPGKFVVNVPPASAAIVKLSLR